METLFVVTYGVCFALIGGGAFAMMWSNIKSINEEAKKPPLFVHPEAPKPGDEVMYVDLTKERLEKIYDDN